MSGWFNWFMKHCDYCVQFITPSAKVLDVGSGRSKFTSEMAKRGFDAYGIEANPDYIRESQARAEADRIEIKITQAKAEKLPFVDNYFDFVNCSEVTEHADDPEQVCKEIFRVLKLNGKCYISFHNRFGIYDYHYHLYFINWMPRKWAEFILKFFNKQKADSIIGRQRLVTMHYYTYSYIKKILKNDGFLLFDIREEKIKQNYKYKAFPFLMVYYFLRPFYFNTFHLLVKKV